MPTRFRLQFEGDSPDIDLPRFNQSLSNGLAAFEEDGSFFVLVPSQEDEDPNCQYLIDRELDRHFFLTSVKIKAEMVTRRITASVEIGYRIHGALDENIAPQVWCYDLSIQLRLWSLADEARDHVVKIILLYQIVELSSASRANTARYTDSSVAPDPLVECRFVRNLAAHSGVVGDPQLQIYCEYLGLPATMHDPTDSAFSNILKGKVPLLEQVARSTIENSL